MVPVATPDQRLFTFVGAPAGPRRVDRIDAIPLDERRDIFMAQSRHCAIGLRDLPAAVRRLHHCRDLGPDQPFDFLTWFEYAPAEATATADAATLLWPTAWIGNARALAFYLRRGYDGVGATPYVFEGEQHETRVFAKRLPDRA